MSKQCGHGYYKGIEAAQVNNGTLAGLWFHYPGEPAQVRDVSYPKRRP